MRAHVYLVSTSFSFSHCRVMTPEQRAREHIDQLLSAAGWAVQDRKDLNLGAGLGVAVRYFPLQTGEADYMLFVNRKAAGVIEAKPEGYTLGGVAEQSAKYLIGLPETIPHVEGDKLPFAYESTGIETLFRDERDPDARSRRVFAFPKPETLHEWSQQPETLRARLRTMPPLITEGLRGCQVEAIEGLEKSLKENRPRALIQMATGSGKTYTAVTASYRLIKFADARRVLFLVDRANLGRQTEKEFQQYVTPDDGRKFTELYNVQRLTANTIDSVSRVCISTIQRVYSMLKGRELDEETEERSLYEMGADGQPLDVVYNPALPPETFDFVIVDECHRSIYNLWRQVIEYFDAFLIGLTATPSKQTFGFFKQNLVMEYPHARAVADGVNVGFDVYRIRTQITEEGSHVEAGHFVTKRDKLTRRERIERLDESLEYEQHQLDRSVVSPSQIRTVIRTYRDRLFTDIFPGRKVVPKTLIFAKDDNHAEEILHIVREEFGKGNEFAKKITYKTTGEKPENLIAEFRNAPMPRIAVSVDMIATGTDIKPLECLLFMRDVKSNVYFEQMKGRGTRTIDPTDLQAVTGDATRKTHFVIVDAVGVTETEKGDAQPLERKKSVAFDKLLHGVALGVRDEDSLSSLAGRLARFDRTLDADDREKIEKTAGGTPLKTLINGLLDAVDPDRQVEKAMEMFTTDAPGVEQRAQAARALADEACRPFDDPALRNLIVDIRQRNEITIDTVSIDEVLYAGPDDRADGRAAQVVQSFRDFIEAHKDEITALQVFYSQPYGQRHLTLRQIKELAEAIALPPLGQTPETLWAAYAKLEKDKVKGAGEKRLLTDIITLVRHAMGEDEVLAPFREVVEERFYAWLNAQDRAGRFTPEQMEWLDLIKQHLAASLSIEPEDFEYAPFHERGGRFKAIRLFGRDELRTILSELNEAIVA